jgi:hypothetical protein
MVPLKKGGKDSAFFWNNKFQGENWGGDVEVSGGKFLLVKVSYSKL